MESGEVIARLRADLEQVHRDYAHLLRQFVAERDDARRLYCFRCREDEAGAREIAKTMKWNCFPYIAPTRADAGGAEHQIPEAL